MNKEFFERAKTATKQVQKENLYLGRSMCLNDDGFAWVFLGDTYSIKEELKALGARFNYFLGWYMHTKPETGDYPFVEVHISDLCYMDPDTGEYWCGDNTCRRDERTPRDFLDDLKNEAMGVTGNVVGEVGNKIDMNLKLIGVRSWTEQGYNPWDPEVTKYCYKFEDAAGNALCWFTTVSLSWKGYEEGDMIPVKATIKEHSIYLGVRQTVLTRCRIPDKC